MNWARGHQGDSAPVPGLTGQTPGECVCALPTVVTEGRTWKPGCSGRELSRCSLGRVLEDRGLLAREGQLCKGRRGRAEPGLAGCGAAGVFGVHRGAEGAATGGTVLPGSLAWGTGRATPSSKPSGSGTTSYLHGLHGTDRPPSLLPKDPQTRALSAAGVGRGEGAGESPRVSSSRPESCTHGDRDPQSVAESGGHGQEGERKEGERLGREMSGQGDRERAARAGSGEGTAGAGRRVGRTPRAGGRQSGRQEAGGGADNGGRSADPGPKFGVAVRGAGRALISMQRRDEMNMQRGL